MQIWGGGEERCCPVCILEKNLTEEEEAESRLIDKVGLKDLSRGEEARLARGWASVTSGDSAQHTVVWRQKALEGRKGCVGRLWPDTRPWIPC